MWEARYQKTRTTVRKKVSPYKARLRVRRWTVEYWIKQHPEQKWVGHILINDLDMKGFRLYVSDYIPENFELEILLPFKEPITLRVKTGWCAETFSGSHILSKTHFSKRVLVMPQFEGDEEKEKVKALFDLFKSENVAPKDYE